MKPARLAVLALLFVRGATPAVGVLYNRSYVSPADRAVRIYDLRTPAAYDGVAKRPAVLFLHGRGGTKDSFQLSSYLKEADARGYVLVFWQGRLDPNGNFSTYYVDAANGFPDETDVLACLDDALSSFAIDPTRVHLVGFSQGGKGALLVGLKNPDRFASIAEGAGPTDAFEGQLWTPGFPDYRDAAGGDYASAGGPVLARWYAQSPRFFLRNARNVPVALFHGGLDTNVPDSLALFPYRNTHHVADTSGFADARGARPTLSELRAADGDGYVFETHYPPDVGHEEERLLVARTLFDFFDGKVRPDRPSRVSASTYDAHERRLYWVRLGRTASPDGTEDAFAASVDAGANRLDVSLVGSPDLTLDASGAGLDLARKLALRVEGGRAAALRVAGTFAASTSVSRDGVSLREGIDYARDASGLTFSALGAGAGTELVIDPNPPIAPGDLLVPALVEIDGLNGARFSTELALANASSSPLAAEALLLDATGGRASLAVWPRSTRVVSSAELFALLGRGGGAAPLRLRVVQGPPEALLASARVFNRLEGGGTYGLSFPVVSAEASVVGPGGTAYLFGGTDARPSRVNVSLFAPFEAAAGTLQLVDDLGRTLRTLPFTLAPLERSQLGDLLSGLPSPVRIVLSVSAGRVQAYATVISSSATNDPYRSPAIPTTLASTEWTVPAVAAAPGKNGAIFSSDLFLASLPSAQEVTIPVDVTFRPRTGAPLTVTIGLAPGTTSVLEDVLTRLFPGDVPGAGALQVRSATPILVFAVTRSDPPTGPSSQDLPCVPKGLEILGGVPAAFVGLAESAGARSNLVLVNRGGATAVSLTLLAEDGERGVLSVPLGEGEVKQLDSVASLFALREAAAATLLVAPEPGGAVVASMSRIDNLTNDPAGLARVPLR